MRGGALVVDLTTQKAASHHISKKPIGPDEALLALEILRIRLLLRMMLSHRSEAEASY